LPKISSECGRFTDEKNQTVWHHFLGHHVCSIVVKSGLFGPHCRSVYGANDPAVADDYDDDDDNDVLMIIVMMIRIVMMC